MVETALELGIRYFDVAPSYGLGTAEDVIGATLAGVPEVTIATKVGVPRPAYSGGQDFVRRSIKRVLDLVPALRPMARRAVARPSSDRPRYDFSASAVRESLHQSLERLRRDRVDIFLAHEPHPDDLNEENASGFEALRREGLFTAFGIGIGATEDRWRRFGSIWQSAWPGEDVARYEKDVARVWHGAIRGARPNHGRAQAPASIVREVLERSPESILLVSAATPARLRELMSEVG